MPPHKPPDPAPVPETTPHDEFFKEIFGDLDHARDLLRGILPSDLQEILDLDHLQRENSSFLTAQLAEDFADLVFTCPTTGGTALVALLLEHKSWAPRHPHLQLLTYMLGIWEQSEKSGNALPPVIPVVLYNGQGAWKVRDFIQSFPGLPDRLRPFLPEFRFLLLDLARKPLEPLRDRFHNRSVRLAIELMRSIFTPTEVRSLMERLTPEDGPLDKDLAFRFLRVVLRYIFKRSDTDVREALSYALHPATREVTMTWEEQLIQRGEQKGLEKGLERGLRAKALEDARRMREHSIAWEVVTNITGITPVDLET
jgi:predicted transposase/invertase (TIGR01784 family)